MLNYEKSYQWKGLSEILISLPIYPCIHRYHLQLSRNYLYEITYLWNKCLTLCTYYLFQNHFKFSYYFRLVQALCIGPALVFYKMITTYRCNKSALHDKNEKSCTVNWSTSISMCKVERIKQVTRSSYNCVFLSAVTGGLRYVLQSSGIKHPPDLKVRIQWIPSSVYQFEQLSRTW